MSRLLAPLTAAERPVLVATARALLTAGPGGGPVPFRHRGRTVAGLDCVGLGAYVLAALGREVRDRQHYGRDPVRDGLRQQLVDHFGPPLPSVKELQPADFVLMRWFKEDGVHLFNHVAIVTDCAYGGLNLLHAYAGSKVVVEHRLADPWPRRIIEGYRP